MGGTKIEAVVLAGDRDDPREVARLRIPTEATGGYEHILARTAGLVRRISAEERIDLRAPVGVGMPGSVTRAGLVKNSNTVCLNGTRFRQELAERLGCPTTFANDANCFALAEARMGAGRGHRLVFGVIIGTGVGGGIVIDGEVREGPQSICGEWGHQVLWPDSDRRCYCGHAGCVETHLAGPWVARHYREQGGDELALPEIIERRAAGEGRAVEVIDAWLGHFGRALANLVNLLDPDVIVIGGGASRAAVLYDEGRREVASRVFNDELLTPIVPNELGDSAGVLGAALLVG